MMVRTITLEEITRFEQIGKKSNGNAMLNLHQWLDIGKTTLEWCFVIEEEGEFLGRVIYGIFENQPNDLVMWQIKIADSAYNFVAIGSRLIGDSIGALKSKGFNTVEYHLYSTVPETFELLKLIFRKQGFHIVQEKKSFEDNHVSNIETAKRLKYQTLQEVGEDGFIDAIKAVTDETLDREDAISIATHGSNQAAILYFELLKEIDFNETWWKVAYNEKGEFVGLVVPPKFGEDRGAINYIGVIPEKRGKGYVNDLLWEGSKILIDDGIKSLIADIDVQNYPLEKALNLLGYEYKRLLIVFKLDL